MNEAISRCEAKENLNNYNMFELKEEAERMGIEWLNLTKEKVVDKLIDAGIQLGLIR
jgi:hypothetical protein